MPELPEVETVVRTLRPTVTGKRISAVRLMRQDIVSPAGFDLVKHLTGRVVTQISRRGKRIVFDLDDDGHFYIHLGMTGRMTVEKPESEQRTHTHLILEFGKTQVRFVDPRRFGGIFWLGNEIPDHEGMGPEPLTMRPAQLAKALKRTSRVIKTALLDQKLVAGLGNIYVDEALFTSGIHPTRVAKSLTQPEIAKLNRAIKLVLRRALRHRGSTLRDYRDANGESGNFQNLHRVYDRAGKPCANCKTPVERIVLGGRSTHFCPRCQKK